MDDAYINIKTHDNCEINLSSNIDDGSVSDILTCSGIDKDHIHEIIQEISKSKSRRSSDSHASHASHMSHLARNCIGMPSMPTMPIPKIKTTSIATQTDEIHPLKTSFKLSAHNLLSCLRPQRQSISR